MFRRLPASFHLELLPFSGILRAVRLTACQGIKDSLRRLYLDDPRNGLALSRNGHWMFDAGLWSLDDDYRVASNRFDGTGDAAFLLKRMSGQKIELTDNRYYWPDKAHLAWHRKRYDFEL